MNSNYDVIIAGAGFAGAVCARVFADNGLKVLVLEKREHIGGNAYDCTDENGVVIHKYGPHIFHTNSKKVFGYLSRFTEWNGYEHKVLANVNGSMLPVPFNFRSIDMSFSDEVALETKNLLAEKYGENGTVSILDLINDDNATLAKLGKFVYETVFEKYTMKQWGMRPEEIDPATTARVPVRLSYDCRYFTD